MPPSSALEPRQAIGLSLETPQLPGHDAAAMRLLAPGHFRTVADFRAHLQEHGIDIALDDAFAADGAMAAPLPLFGRSVPNRFCTHPMEGWDGTDHGAPTELTLRRWYHFGRSGAGLVWGGEAFAVLAEGRANPHQLCRHADSERDLVALRQHIEKGREDVGLAPDGAVVGLQLTHSGRFCRPHGPLQPVMAHHYPLLSRKYQLSEDQPPCSDGELERIGEAMVETAVLAQRTGFLFVDVKCCHGYLLHEVLCAHTRPGPYGGDLQGRTRLLGRIIQGIRRDCPGLGIGVRLSAGDTAPFQQNADTRVGEPMPHEGLEPWRYHFGMAKDDPQQIDLTEPIALLQQLLQLGVPIVNVTLGSPYWNPHLQRPAAYPPSDGYLPPQDPLLMVARHLDTVRALKQAVPGMLMVGTGYTYLQEYLPHTAQRQVADGAVDLVGLGRLLLSYPELPLDLLAGRTPDRRRYCRTFSDCTTGPRNGMVSGCFPLDPFYGERPEALRIKAIKKELAK